MTDEQKKEALKKLKRADSGDCATVDDDLEKSVQYKPENQAFKDKYKEYYDDVKLHIKEDW